VRLAHLVPFTLKNHCTPCNRGSLILPPMLSLTINLLIGHSNVQYTNKQPDSNQRVSPRLPRNTYVIDRPFQLCLTLAWGHGTSLMIQISLHTSASKIRLARWLANRVCQNLARMSTEFAHLQDVRSPHTIERGINYTSILYRMSFCEWNWMLCKHYFKYG
jgi:hypothetical protein